MVKKFKKWRDNLTVSQAHKIRRIVTIITEILIMLGVILKWERLTNNLGYGILVWLNWFVVALTMYCTVGIVMYLVLNLAEKEIELTEKEIRSQLKEDELTEIYLKQGTRRNVSKIIVDDSSSTELKIAEIRRNVSKVILDRYDAHKKRYFAKKEDDGIYVIMKEDESVIKDYHTSDYSFLDYHFTFTKEEK